MPTFKKNLETTDAPVATVATPYPARLSEASGENSGVESGVTPRGTARVPPERIPEPARVLQIRPLRQNLGWGMATPIPAPAAAERGDSNGGRPKLSFQGTFGLGSGSSEVRSV